MMEYFIGTVITVCLLFGFISSIYIMAVERQREKKRNIDRARLYNALKGDPPGLLRERGKIFVKKGGLYDKHDNSLEYLIGAIEDVSLEHEDDTVHQMSYENEEYRSGPEFIVSTGKHISFSRDGKVELEAGKDDS